MADAPFKYTGEYAESLLPSLRRTFDAFGQDFTGKKILDFGCHWGYFAKDLLARGAREVHGMDIIPHWNEVTDINLGSVPGLKLFAGDILTLPELQSETYDIIVSSGTLFLLSPPQLEAVLAWFYDHVAPGGVAILNTRTVFARSGFDSHVNFGKDVPIPHLLFPRRILDGYLASQNRPRTRDMISYCATTWLTTFRCAGFDIEQVTRHGNDIPPEMLAQFQDRLGWHDEQEVNSGEVTALLRKPASPPDIQSIAIESARA